MRCKHSLQTCKLVVRQEEKSLKSAAITPELYTRRITSSELNITTVY